MTSSLLFDKSSARDVDVESAAGELRKNTLLWVDLARDEEEEIRRAAAALEITEMSSERIFSEVARAGIESSRSQLHLTVLAPAREHDLIQIDCIVGNLWLLTVHPGSVEALKDFRDRVTGRGELGQLDAPTFLADLLEWVLGAYVDAFERIEDDLEETEIAAIRATDDEIGGWVERFVSLRREAGRLRRALASHRQVFVALAHPEFDPVSTDRSAERFAGLVDTLGGVLDTATATRESMLGSFELLVARAGQRTNETMKVLTLVSVLVLPATALAGILGMNFKVGLFDHPSYFWIAVGAMVVVASVTLAVARLRSWI